MTVICGCSLIPSVKSYENFTGTDQSATVLIKARRRIVYSEMLKHISLLVTSSMKKTFLSRESTHSAHL
jgi:hypothetical protein